ncbi:Bifunctional inhibitor/plant lipid transfer protein/seed storage helical domain-containing protein [Cynara cardunculus var. scolymus]|uniref:Bifunctional inhibitor/plant lipid transfer protein/seed storage helical domain-containing protein n=1 Tax=Cynara cardunculus var. scolymus TaxID=59895 RepID=A0A118JWB6_CYNCS|nr:Bifunctional inhibitor/plant lipid transfer protein/seed storage helical domain-containing protein [Cynara cardunculus var. scolymus]
MAHFASFLAAILSISVVITVNGQISSPCSVSMITSFTPCVNFVTGSSSNGRSPTASCCSAVESLTTTSMECMCLIVTGNVAFSLPNPINQALAITLPKACKSKRVPLQCKCSKKAMLAPTPSKTAPAVLPDPGADQEPNAPDASAPIRQAPIAGSGIRPVLTPVSASNPLSVPPPLLLLMLVATTVTNFCQVFLFRSIL